MLGHDHMHPWPNPSFRPSHVAERPVVSPRKGGYRPTVGSSSGIAVAALGKRLGVSRNLVLYAVFGAAGAAVDLGVFALVYRGWHVDKNVAAATSSFWATTLTFLLNARINFRQWNRLLVRYVLYLAVAAIGISVTILTFYIFVDLVHYTGPPGEGPVARSGLHRPVHPQSTGHVPGRPSLRGPGEAARSCACSGFELAQPSRRA